MGTGSRMIGLVNLDNNEQFDRDFIEFKLELVKALYKAMRNHASSHDWQMIISACGLEDCSDMFHVNNEH